MTTRKRLPAPGKQNAGGLKGKSGPPQNLNHCTRPWEVFWRRRALRAEDRWILGVLGSYIAGLVADKPAASNAEQRMMELAQIARGATMLCLAETARTGFVVKGRKGAAWDLHPGAKELVRFLQVERQALRDLGLQRRCRVVTPSLEDLLRDAAAEAGEGGTAV